MSSSTTQPLEVIVGCKVAFKYGRTHKVGIVVGHDGSYEGSRPWKVYFSGVAGGEDSYKWSFRNASDLKVLDYFDGAEDVKAALQELASEKVAISEGIGCTHNSVPLKRYSKVIATRNREVEI